MKTFVIDHVSCPFWILLDVQKLPELQANMGKSESKIWKPCNFFSPQAKPLASSNISQQALEMDMQQILRSVGEALPHMESMALSTRFQMCMKKFEVRNS